MTSFDDELKKLLNEADDAFIADSIDETGYYKTVFSSLKGQGSGLRIGAWIGVFIAAGLLFFCLWQFFHVESTHEKILYAMLAIMLNSAQIALKLWFNMQINRRALSQEIRRLELVISRQFADKS